MGAVEYRMPESLNLDDVDKCWPRWQRFKQAFKIFLLAAGFERLSEQRKAAILLNCVGHQAQELYFNVLKDGETFDAFYTAIRKLAENCNFDTQKDRMLRDRIVIGVSDHRMQQKLLEVKDLSLDKAVDICRSAELSKEHIKTLTNPEVYAVQTATPQHRGEASSSPSNRAKYTNINNRKSSNSNNNTFNKNFYLCKKCNKEHGPRNCPAFGKTCICSLDLSKNEWLESLDVENKRIIFKCDTGAQINVLGINDLKKIVDDDRRIKLSETKIMIEVFGGTKIVPLGKVKLNIAVKNDECKINTEFIIIKEKVRPILGLSSLIALKLLNNMKKAETITNINTKDTIINNNCELFQGVGEFKNPLKLRVQPGVEPVVRPPRRVPNALRSRLADKLDALVKHKIIDKVDHPKNFVKCKEFAKEWGFKFTYTSPRYPQSNGMAERGVQIAKKMLLKCHEDKTDNRVALLQYRASPVSDGPKPGLRKEEGWLVNGVHPIPPGIKTAVKHANAE
ncbi:hypothetical protein ACJJTC_004214 [Scirpophaga incertulas]